MLSDVKITKTELSDKKPGSDIDSWCGKCKRVLAHTIEAMVGDKVARVNCNTCKSQHIYRPQPPRSTPKREGTGSAPKTGKTRATRYESLLKSKDASSSRTYSFEIKYDAGDILEHPKFGRGVVMAVKDVTKIEVLFESGSKLLVHAR